MSEDNGSQVSWDFFVAHDERSRSYAEELKAELSQRARTFLATRDLSANEVSWPEQIMEAQIQSRITVALLSSSAKPSEFLEEEIQRALLRERRSDVEHLLCAVFVDGRPKNDEGYPYGLLRRQCLDASVLGSAGTLAHVLLRTLSEALSDAPAESTPTGSALSRFPLGPSVLPEHVDPDLKVGLAESFPSSEIAACLARAARACAQDPDAEAMRVVREGSITPIASNSAVEVWGSILREGSLRGPRVLASLLLAIDARMLSMSARAAWEELVERLEGYSR